MRNSYVQDRRDVDNSACGPLLELKIEYDSEIRSPLWVGPRWVGGGGVDGSRVAIVQEWLGGG